MAVQWTLFYCHVFLLGIYLLFSAGTLIIHNPVYIKNLFFFYICIFSFVMWLFFDAFKFLYACCLWYRWLEELESYIFENFFAKGIAMKVNELPPEKFGKIDNKVAQTILKNMVHFDCTFFSFYMQIQHAIVYSKKLELIVFELRPGRHSNFYLFLCHISYLVHRCTISMYAT